MEFDVLWRELAETRIAGNTVQLWLVAVAVALLGFVGVRTTLRATTRRWRARAETGQRAHVLILGLLDATRQWLVLGLVVVGAAALLELPHLTSRVLEHAGFAIVALQLALWANALIKLLLQPSVDSEGHRSLNPVLTSTMVWGAKLIVWVVLLLAFLANVGVDITAFVASLGVGGVAVALALQNILGDLFASVSIGLDKPFEVGEFVAFGSDLGTITHVGVKTTRIASLSGEELAIANSQLLGQLIHNYSRMENRRVVFGFRLPYGTTRDKVQTVIERTRAFIEEQHPTRFDRGHLANFGEYGLEFEFVYYVLDPSYNVFRDVQQAVNLRIMELLEGLEVPFAVPARALRLEPGAPESSITSEARPKSARAASSPTAG